MICQTSNTDDYLKVKELQRYFSQYIYRYVHVTQIWCRSYLLLPTLELSAYCCRNIVLCVVVFFLFCFKGMNTWSGVFSTILNKGDSLFGFLYMKSLCKWVLLMYKRNLHLSCKFIPIRVDLHWQFWCMAFASLSSVSSSLKHILIIKQLGIIINRNTIFFFFQNFTEVILEAALIN